MKDVDIYDEENNFAAIARTSNLNEELGQVDRYEDVFIEIV